MTAPSVLVVEDEWLIAEGLRGELEDMGCRVVGIATNCEQALELLQSDPPDVAFLDLQLGSESCEPVVEECRQRGIAMIFCTGVPELDLPPFAAGYPVMLKPYDQRMLRRRAQAVGLTG